MQRLIPALAGSPTTNLDLALAREGGVLPVLSFYLEQAAQRMCPVSLVGIHIDGALAAGGTAEIRSRMNERIQYLIERSIRFAEEGQGRIRDTVLRVGGDYLVVLFGADRKSALKPIQRILDRLRGELWSIDGALRQIHLGTWTWSLKDAVTPEMAMGRALEALMMSLGIPAPQAAGPLTPSVYDTVSHYAYPWDERHDNEDSRPAAKPQVKRATPMRASVPEGPKTARTFRKASVETARPWWRFWT